MNKWLVFWVLSVCSFAHAEEGEISVEEVQPIDEERSAQEFYAYMQEALDEGDWWAAIDYGQLILYHMPESPHAQEIPYYVGVAYYRLGQHELANEALTDYLKNASAPRHFEEAIEMKFSIAEYYRNGGKKRLFGSHKLPAIMPAREDSLQIYDEVITTLPHHPIAVKAFLGKAEIQAYYEDFKPSIETLQLLIRRFPKDEFAAEAYLRINDVYLQQCRAQHTDPDLLSLAEANLRKFRLAFPREPRVVQAETRLKEMQEIFAQHLLETGHFFQKRKQTDASIIYYTKIVSDYPDTKTAAEARERLEILRANRQF